MAQGSTFPADDVPDRSAAILEVLARHHPVPVPTTTLYLAIEDKRALADTFAALGREGRIVPTVLAPGHPDFEAAVRLSGLGPAAASAPIAVYRLGETASS